MRLQKDDSNHGELLSIIPFHIVAYHNSSFRMLLYFVVFIPYDMKNKVERRSVLSQHASRKIVTTFVNFCNIFVGLLTIAAYSFCQVTLCSFEKRELAFEVPASNERFKSIPLSFLHIHC